ncbi:hypothetical protein Dimus_031121 [Dionaea muscipula]
MSMFMKKQFSAMQKKKINCSSIVIIQVMITLMLCFMVVFLIVVLGVFLNHRIRKMVVLEKYFFPDLVSPLPPCRLSGISTPLREHLGPSSGLREWIEPGYLWHSMTDRELMWRASTVPGIPEYPYNRKPKLAFMFLSKGRLPFAPLWEFFFMGHQGCFSIYLHTSPGFRDELPRSSVFYKRKIPSQEVHWGEATMVDAERRLLANALLDFSNERFILLSESCIPLFNFTTIYNYLVNSNQSYVGSFDDPRNIGRGRYNKRMWPTISLSDWRKGSQWFEVSRKLAVQIVSDVKYYPVLRDHCRRPCYMDEHYLATLVAKLAPGSNSNRSITWVDWSKPGSHPTTFVRKDVSEEFLSRIGDPGNCSYNGVAEGVDFCFLFARKFHPSALQPLLKIAPTALGFGPPT